jgi:hypothetical protein
MANADTGSDVLADPTQNVRELFEAGMQRQDDLRELTAHYTELLATIRQAHINEVSDLRHRYEAELRASETKRLDSIRQVDQAQVQRTADVQTAAAATLAGQVVAMAEAVRITSKADLEPIQKSIDDLRKAQYEQAGSRQQVGESRLNYGAILGGLSLVAVLVFGWLNSRPT